MYPLFKNRFHAGQLLARRLAAYAAHPDLVVLALPRGGVPLGYMVARALAAPLDILMVRKLGLPGQPEYAVGAIGGNGLCLLHMDKIKSSGVPMAAIQAVIERERAQLTRRESLYRAGRPALPLRGKTVILVDDGIATGSSMCMAVQAACRMKPAKIIVAVPVAPLSVRTTPSLGADELICVHSPARFNSVGQWYEDFGQVGDEEVTRLLEKRRAQVQRAGTAVSLPADRPDAVQEEACPGACGNPGTPNRILK